MIKLVIAILFSLYASIANAGTLSFTYTNTAGTTTFAPTATVSDADAAAFISWCQAHYAASGQAGLTPPQCFNQYANWVFARLKNDVLQSAQAAAAQNAAPINVTPAQ